MRQLICGYKRANHPGIVGEIKRATGERDENEGGNVIVDYDVGKDCRANTDRMKWIASFAEDGVIEWTDEVGNDVHEFTQMLFELGVVCAPVEYEFLVIIVSRLLCWR